MTTIGTFTKADDGSFHGTIRTLTFSVKAAEIHPVDRAGEKAPDHRVFAGTLEIGAAWTVARPDKPPCLSVRIDDPSLPSPICAILAQASDDQHELRWTRRG